MINNDLQNTTTYCSLREIRQRKEALLHDIRKDNKQMGKLWKDLFAKPAKSNRKKGFSLASFMGTGMGVVDGALLAWKLYRKFKR